MMRKCNLSNFNESVLLCLHKFHLLIKYCFVLLRRSKYENHNTVFFLSCPYKSYNSGGTETNVSRCVGATEKNCMHEGEKGVDPERKTGLLFGQYSDILSQRSCVYLSVLSVPHVSEFCVKSHPNNHD